MKILKVNYDKLGIITSIACAIHCAVLPVLFSTITFVGVDIVESPVIEYGMIALSLMLGIIAMRHGYKCHHKKILPVLLYTAGFMFLILNQIFKEQFVMLFIPAAVVLIIAAHGLNIYYCRIIKKCIPSPNRN